MLRNPLSIKLLRDATESFLKKISKAKKEEMEVIKEVNKQKDEENIKKIREKLGI
jgi:hypothetical protein